MIAAIYARYSSGQDREQSSTIEAQIAMCKEKALANGWEVDSDNIYVDRAVSGATVNRPAFQEMLAAIES